MRLNQYLAQYTSLSRRSADAAIADGRVSVNSYPAKLGQQVSSTANIALDGQTVKAQPDITLLLNKPIGYICSRRKQGNSPTIYELIPPHYSRLKPVGRLDKDSSGLIIMTSNGTLANQLAHPSFSKWKKYTIQIDRKLTKNHEDIIQKGVMLDDGISKLSLQQKGNLYHISMQEGRNRQIRRTFAALGYTVTKLHRTQIGNHKLGSLKAGSFCKLKVDNK